MAGVVCIIAGAGPTGQRPFPALGGRRGQQEHAAAPAAGAGPRQGPAPRLPALGRGRRPGRGASGRLGDRAGGRGHREGRPPRADRLRPARTARRLPRCRPLGGRVHRRRAEHPVAVPLGHRYRGLPARPRGPRHPDATGQPARRRRRGAGQDHRVGPRRPRTDHPAPGSAGAGRLPGLAPGPVAGPDAGQVRARLPHRR